MEDPRIYVRLANDLREQILDGRLKPDMPVPSIKTVSQENGCSRQTAGKAIGLLEREGLIRYYRGLGYYVNARP